MSQEMDTRGSVVYYPPKVWTDDFMQKQTSVYLGEKYSDRAAKLKENVREMLENVKKASLSDQLELIDVVQRLGLSYHFNHEIQKILASLHTMMNNNVGQKNENLCETALRFRLLRQEGYHVSQDIFKSFINEEGKFDMKLCGNTKGMLSLYEASYLTMEDEHILEMAKEFTTYHLKQTLKQGIEDQNMAEQVSHALEMPLHWRMKRLETRWFIDVYEKREDKNSTILELAKLDFNILQAMHLNELKQLSRWHENVNLAERMDFARSRLVEGFLWSVGFSHEPQFEYCRKISTKSAELITVIDDVCDIHATLQEVEIMADAVKRWDINALEELPNYTKICFLALFNYVNEVVYDILQEQGINVLPYIKKVWSDLCETYLVEAKWYNNGITPSLKEYLENALVSISGPLLILQAYISIANPIKMEDLQHLVTYPSIIRYPSLILRLTDDLGTSPDEMARGDTSKSIQCYMQESGSSEDDAQKMMREMVEATWKKMNKEILMDTHFCRDYIQIAMNMARISQCMYQYGDGYGRPEGVTKDRIKSLFFEHIPLP
ncbi:PREDICTED: (-)-alpha-terpineol synthase-like [Ipomoea nil]|uniref:(-)-alpha-terpineol synthase-like n=1 Tax=Ipomoea nil TaxID=35883 RepID=UPI0009009D50|nr:PREDICTED: (-)-alpha-terpineol synthase-like [Ipomoea nil]XP_019163652.1 PREDICTED: (-)-alpha-terpineol synthase-like [Ipomoea nil]